MGERKKHPKKEIEKALREAEQAGLVVTDASGGGHSTHVLSGDPIRRHIRRNTRDET